MAYVGILEPTEQLVKNVLWHAYLVRAYSHSLQMSICLLISNVHYFFFLFYSYNSSVPGGPNFLSFLKLSYSGHHSRWVAQNTGCLNQMSISSKGTPGMGKQSKRWNVFIFLL